MNADAGSESMFVANLVFNNLVFIKSKVVPVLNHNTMIMYVRAQVKLHSLNLDIRCR
jgi:hypothetical protein